MISARQLPERPIREAIRDLRTSTIELRDSLAGLERDWLVGRLLASRGICEVDYPIGAGNRRLTVEYDAGELNGAALIDLLDCLGLRVRTVPPVR
ncbi:MAG TPA: hypothetical protein VMV37_02160 [Gammaproteobacteria bacterium]|nr:hypothetical protein [Gammaproteobacteria bacterium]